MTWRRFLALVRGLSPLSALLNAGEAQSQARPGKPGEVITDAAEGERAVLRLIGGGA